MNLTIQFAPITLLLSLSFIQNQHKLHYTRIQNFKLSRLKLTDKLDSCLLKCLVAAFISILFILTK